MKTLKLTSSELALLSDCVLRVWEGARELDDSSSDLSERLEAIFNKLEEL